MGRFWSSLSLRVRVAVELLTLAAAAALFLVRFPARTIAVDVPLALLALALVGLDARRTKTAIWGEAAGEPRERGRKAVFFIAAVTVPAIVLFFAAGAVIGYRAGGWPGAFKRLFQTQMAAAFAFYLLWALIQQTLLQFYLLGRLRRLLPGLPLLALCALNGLAFAGVHWPQPALMALTALAGAVWSWSYLRHRTLWPLAVSHAALGSAFYYWVWGRDLAGVWAGLLAR